MRWRAVHHRLALRQWKMDLWWIHLHRMEIRVSRVQKG
jgi:hypothetical protein